MMVRVDGERDTRLLCPSWRGAVVRELGKPRDGAPALRRVYRSSNEKRGQSKSRGFDA